MLQTKSQTAYTIKELQSYVKNPNSSVHRITDKLHVGMSPAGLANFKESVIACVTRSKIGRFDQKLNGIVLDIRNYKILGNVFPIHDDDPQLHVDLKADLYVFQPTVGAVIKGVIKHIARGHISVTVHRVFNVAIRLDGDKEGLAVNMEIVIRITDFDLTLKLPFIAGVLDQPPKLANKKIVFNENAVLDSEDDEVMDQKGLVAQFLSENNIKIKKEPLSESSSESSNFSDTDGTKSARDDRRTKKLLKREPSVDSSSDSSSSDEVKIPVAQIKREQTSSSSSDSSSSDDDDTTITTKRSIKLETKSVKHESSSSSSSDSSSSDEDSKSKVKKYISIKQKNPVEKMKRKASSALNEHTPKKTKASLDDSLANLSAFTTPGLSSTMKPESAGKSSSSKKKAAKHKDKLQELMDKMLARV